MLTHKKLKEKALSNPKVKAEYESLEPEFSLLRSLLKARRKADLTQDEVAELMGTQTATIARLESFDSKHSPSIKILRKYAEAVGCRLEIKLVPR